MERQTELPPTSITLCCACGRYRPEGEAPRLRHCAGLDEDVGVALALELELSGVEALPSAEGVFSLSTHSVCCFGLDEQAEIAKQAASRRVRARGRSRGFSEPVNPSAGRKMFEEDRESSCCRPAIPRTVAQAVASFAAFVNRLGSSGGFRRTENCERAIANSQPSAHCQAEAPSPSRPLRAVRLLRPVRERLRCARRVSGARYRSTY